MRRLLQFTLDLFDPQPPAPPLVPPITGAPPAEPLSKVLAPARFAHPHANREVILEDGTRVAYAFRHGQRRTIGFSVGPDGLAVRAPKWVTLGAVDAALREKGAWILRKLDESHERQRQLAAVRIAWQAGATLPFLGDPVVLALDPRQGHGAVFQPGAAAAPDGPGHRLQLGLPHSATPEQIRDAVQAWLMRQARRIFTERLDHFAPQLGVQWKRLSLSSAGTRWGSARADGSIRLNWRLVHFRPTVMDYVVAHELAHLREMNHSPRFWETVRSVMPDYELRREALREELLPPW
jgi:predicted metal-dependent hydrolase